MKRIFMMMILLCAMLNSIAQSNFVKNPGFEQYSKCPDEWNQINYCKYWSIPGDSTTTIEYCLEYYNECGNVYPDIVSHVPDNLSFYQNPKSGKGFAGSTLYYDNPPLLLLDLYPLIIVIIW